MPQCLGNSYQRLALSATWTAGIFQRVPPLVLSRFSSLIFIFVFYDAPRLRLYIYIYCVLPRKALANFPSAVCAAQDMTRRASKMISNSPGTLRSMATGSGSKPSQPQVASSRVVRFEDHHMLSATSERSFPKTVRVLGFPPPVRRPGLLVGSSVIQET